MVTKEEGLQLYNLYDAMIDRTQKLLSEHLRIKESEANERVKKALENEHIRMIKNYYIIVKEQKKYYKYTPDFKKFAK